MTFPVTDQPYLTSSTIVPQEDELFVPYLTRLYEKIAATVNNKDNAYFQLAITNTAQNIPNVANYGSFIICVSGTDSTLPTITASLCKADATAAGSIAALGSQVGTGATWAGIALTITSTATNFQIAHNLVTVPVTSGNFNIKVIGTQ